MKGKKDIAQPVRLSDFVWCIDDFSCYRNRLDFSGWIFHKNVPICSLACVFPDGNELQVDKFRLPSPDVEKHYGKKAKNVRFSFSTVVSNPQDIFKLRVICTLKKGQRQELPNLVQITEASDPYHQLFRRFQQEIHSINSGYLLEIGSRNRSGNIRRGICPEGMEYKGLDIVEGENVDVVGDAHSLSLLFPKEYFTAIFAISVFEHLSMPWKVVIEANKVLKKGGFLFIATHQTWPVHEAPWDFWRFSEYSWSALLNNQTGFEIIDIAMGIPGSVIPRLANPVTLDLPSQPAYLGTAVLVRKISDTCLFWDVDPKGVVRGTYPH